MTLELFLEAFGPLIGALVIVFALGIVERKKRR
jgi:hypothetical protein